jgi:hypothetical protein
LEGTLLDEGTPNSRMQVPREAANSDHCRLLQTRSTDEYLKYAAT